MDEQGPIAESPKPDRWFRTELLDALGPCLLFAGTGLLVPIVTGAMSLVLGIGLMSGLLLGGIALYSMGAREHRRLEEDKDACEAKLKISQGVRDVSPDIAVSASAVPDKEAPQINYAQRIAQERQMQQETTASAQR